MGFFQPSSWCQLGSVSEGVSVEVLHCDDVFSCYLVISLFGRKMDDGWCFFVVFNHIAIECY